MLIVVFHIFSSYGLGSYSILLLISKQSLVVLLKARMEPTLSKNSNLKLKPNHSNLPSLKSMVGKTPFD